MPDSPENNELSQPAQLARGPRVEVEIDGVQRRFRMLDPDLHLETVAAAREFAAQTGLLVPPPPGPPAMPRSVSLAQWQTPIQSQGTRGTCWAFAGAAALEAAYHRHLGSPIKVSEEYVYSIGRTVRIESGTMEYPCSIWGGQGCSNVVLMMQHDGIPPAAQTHPYVDSQSGIEQVAANFGISVQEAISDMRAADSFEFSDDHIPLLARVNARYRCNSSYLLSDYSDAAIKAVLASGHEVVIDVNGGVGGHCMLIVGYDHDAGVWEVKNSWGESGFRRLKYGRLIDADTSTDFGTIVGAGYIGGVVDPSVPDQFARWLGHWNASGAGFPPVVTIRRHSRLDRRPGDILPIGAAYDKDKQYPMDGQFYTAQPTPGSEPDGSELTVIVTGAPGMANESTRVRLHDSDPYVATGETLGGTPVTLSRFQQRYASVWVDKPGFTWQARHGISTADYQGVFDELTSQGYRPQLVQGSAVGTGAEVASVWAQADGPAWEASHGIPIADFQDHFDEHCGRGLRLTDVSGYAEDGAAYFTTLWETSDGRGWSAHTHLDIDGLNSELSSARANGFQARRITGYRVGIERRFNVILEYAPDETVNVHVGLDSRALRDTLAGLPQGEHVSWITGYPDTGSARFIVISSTSAAPSEVIFGLTGDGHQGAFDRRSRIGKFPLCVSGYGDQLLPTGLVHHRLIVRQGHGVTLPDGITVGHSTSS